MATIGVFGKIQFSGFIAWMACSFVHIFFLIGFRNRILLSIDEELNTKG